MKSLVFVFLLLTIPPALPCSQPLDGKDRSESFDIDADPHLVQEVIRELDPRDLLNEDNKWMAPLFKKSDTREGAQVMSRFPGIVKIDIRQTQRDGKIQVKVEGQYRTGWIRSEHHRRTDIESAIRKEVRRRQKGN